MPKCDTGKGTVVIDGLMATAAGIVALSLVANDLPGPALIPAGIGALYIGGAVHGSRAVDSCRAAMDEFSGNVAARDTLDRMPPPPRSVEEEISGVDAPPPPKKKRPVPPPVAVQPPAPTPDVETPPPDTEQEQEQPATAPVQPPVQQPPAKQPPAQPPKKKMPPSRPAPSDDEWGDFWREVQ